VVGYCGVTGERVGIVGVSVYPVHWVGLIVACCGVTGERVECSVASVKFVLLLQMLSMKRKRQDHSMVAPLQEVCGKKPNSSRRNNSAIGVRRQGECNSRRVIFIHGRLTVLHEWYV
jgi:hypothetical protein